MEYWVIIDSISLFVTSMILSDPAKKQTPVKVAAAHLSAFVQKYRVGLWYENRFSYDGGSHHCEQICGITADIYAAG